MRSLLFLFVAPFLLLGCRGGRQEVRDAQACYRSEPSSREEARLLMRDLEDEAHAARWEAGVLLHMREQMRGRLLAAGLDDAEIDVWVRSEG